MARYAVGLEYDGKHFSGWQSQPNLPTVQASLEAALSRVAAQTIQVVGAGRTDAGVHAREQVAHFDMAAVRTERALVLGANTGLPPSIALRWVRGVADHFHARYSALSRTYRYVILNRTSRSALTSGRAAFVHRSLELEPMQQAADHLLGTHDFSAFRAAECQANSPVRELTRLQLSRVGEFIILEVCANAFLHHMVRNIAGLLIHVGQGDAAASLAGEILAGRDRKLAPATAPAQGLYLWRVNYPAGFGLPTDSDMMASPAGCPADLLE
jgi:tRNA pseudouridine38-40 synthase